MGSLGKNGLTQSRHSEERSSSQFKTVTRSRMVMDNHGEKLDQVTKFKYLGSMIREDDDKKAVKARGEAAWQKVCEVSVVKLPQRVKMKIYITVILPVLMYEAETQALK